MADENDPQESDRWRRTKDGAEFHVDMLWTESRVTEVKVRNVATGRAHWAPIAGFLKRHALVERGPS